LSSSILQGPCQLSGVEIGQADKKRIPAPSRPSRGQNPTPPRQSGVDVGLDDVVHWCAPRSRFTCSFQAPALQENTAASGITRHGRWLVSSLRRTRNTCLRMFSLVVGFGPFLCVLRAKRVEHSRFDSALSSSTRRAFIRTPATRSPPKDFAQGRVVFQREEGKRVLPRVPLAAGAATQWLSPVRIHGVRCRSTLQAAGLPHPSFLLLDHAIVFGPAPG